MKRLLPIILLAALAVLLGRAALQSMSYMLVNGIWTAVANEAGTGGFNPYPADSTTYHAVNQLAYDDEYLVALSVGVDQKVGTAADSNATIGDTIFNKTTDSTAIVLRACHTGIGTKRIGVTYDTSGYWILAPAFIDTLIVSGSEDTAFVNGDGKASDWVASTGSPWDCVNERPPSNTDYVYPLITLDFGWFTCNVDTTWDIDSVKIIGQCRAFTADSVRLNFDVDTSGGSTTVLISDTSVVTASGVVTFASHRIANLTKAKAAAMQIGFRTGWVFPGPTFDFRLYWCGLDVFYANHHRFTTHTSRRTTVLNTKRLRDIAQIYFAALDAPATGESLLVSYAAMNQYYHGNATNRIVYHDTVDFVMGQIAPPLVQAIDTANVSADGDSAVSWLPHVYTNIDETTPNDADYESINSTGSAYSLILYQIDADTSKGQYIDSVVIMCRATNTGTDTKHLQFAYTPGQGAPPTFTTSLSLPTSGTYADFVSQGITDPNLTKSVLKTLQIGIRNIEVPTSKKEFHVSWLAAKVFWGTHDDRWADSHTYVGRRNGLETGSTRSRVLLALRNTDSLGAWGGDTTVARWIDTLALLKIMVDSLKPTGTRYLIPRLILPQNVDDTTAYAVNGAAANSVAYPHSNYTYWHSSDTAWNTVGADGAGTDWENADFDSFLVTHNATTTVNITPWITHLRFLNATHRRQINGIEFITRREDSTADSWAKLGQVQPPAGTDSTWIEIYRYWNYANLSGGFDNVQQPPGGPIGPWFGDNTDRTTNFSLKNQITGFVDTAATSGTGNGIWVYGQLSWSSGTIRIKCALYSWDGTTATLVTNGQTAESTWTATNPSPNTRWYYFPFESAPSTPVHPTITAGQPYLICAWAANVGTMSQKVGGNQTGHQIRYKSSTYGSWPTPTFTGTSTLTSYVQSICCVYTTGAGGNMFHDPGMTGGMNQMNGGIRRRPWRNE